MLDGFSQANSNACIWNCSVAASDKSAMRTGIVEAIWSDVNGTVEFSEVSTKDLGNPTSDITFSVAIVGGIVQLSATNAGSMVGWTVKAKRDLV